jgi:hypothetical protein
MKTKLLSALALSLALAATARAETTNSWVDGDGKWEAATNWSLGVSPSLTGQSVIVIANAGNNTVTIDATTAITTNSFGSTLIISNLLVQGFGSDTNTLFLNNASAGTTIRNNCTISANGALLLANSTIEIRSALTMNGEMLLRAGGTVLTTNSSANLVGFGGVGNVTLLPNSLWRAIAPNVGTLGGTGTLTINGGTLETVGVGLDLGVQVASAIDSTGTVWVNDGTIVATRSASTIGIGRGSLILSNGFVHTSSIYVGRIQGPGNLTVAGGSLRSTGFLDVGVQGGTGDVFVTGGELVVTNTGAGFAIGTIFLGENGLGRMTISNGTVIARNLVIATNDVARGELNLVGGNLVILSDSNGLLLGQTPQGTGIVTVAGGEITATNSPTVIGSFGTGIMTISSGTVVASDLVLCARTNTHGLLRISEGLMLVQNNLSVAVSSISSGRVELLGGILMVDGIIGIGNDGTTTGCGGDGTMTVSNSVVTARSILLGSADCGQGELAVQSGGSVNVSTRLASNNGLLDGGMINGPDATLSVGEDHVASFTISNGVATFRTAYVGFNNTGTLTMPGGMMSVSNMVVGDCGASVTGVVVINGGSLFVTNASGNAVLQVSGGTMTLMSGRLTVDSLVTNACGHFVRLGGTLRVGGVGTITVSSTADSGAGTLRDALASALDGDTIDASGISGTISLSSGELLVDKSVSIIGSGPASLAVDGNGNNRVFHVSLGKTVMISSLSITNGNADVGGGIYNDHADLTVMNCAISDNAADFGGGIFIDASNGGATQMVVACTINGNSAAYGGGIYNQGLSGVAVVRIAASTLSGNSANASGPDGGYGGGIFNDAVSGGVATQAIANSTFSGNSADVAGGGIYNNNESGTATVEIGSTIFNAGASGANIVNNSGTVTSDGYNLSSDNAGGYFTAPADQPDTNPLLGPLQDNGGPTYTHALLTGSPAVDKGNRDTIPTLCPCDTDQRGFTRPIDDPIIANAPGGDGSDIGAFEVQSILLCTPVSITCPADTNVSVKACSAVVKYQTPTTSGDCGTVTVSCAPTNGATFQTGSTTVSCCANDTAGNSDCCNFTVTVKETAPPTIKCPPNITTNTCNSTAVVTFAPTANDNCPGVTSSCTPPSGSAFPHGKTVVTCTATDRSGNTATCLFTVSVAINAPSAPSDLKARAGTGSVKLTWKASKGADPITYNIKRSTKAGAETPYATTTVTSYTDSAVVKGKKYYYVVTATNCKATSGKSNEVSAVPK